MMKALLLALLLIGGPVHAGIDKEWKIKNDEFTRKNDQCINAFSSAQFKAEKKIDRNRPFSTDDSHKYKRWVVNGRKVYWVTSKWGECERGQVFTLDIESQEKCWDDRPYQIKEDRRYDCIRLFKIEKDSITNIPYLYEYRKSKRFGLIREIQGVPVNHEELVLDAYQRLNQER